MIIIVLVIASALIASFALLGAFEPYPKKVILKAEDMAGVTGWNEGAWTQNRLVMFDDNEMPYSGAKQAAYSSMHFDNNTFGATVDVVITEMASAELATSQWRENTDDDAYRVIELGIGDGGTFVGLPAYNSQETYDFAHVYFHKGVYFVVVYADSVGDAVTSDFLEHIALEQASRL